MCEPLNKLNLVSGGGGQTKRQVEESFPQISTPLALFK